MRRRVCLKKAELTNYRRKSDGRIAKGDANKLRTCNLKEIEPGVYRGRDARCRLIEMRLLDVLYWKESGAWVSTSTGAEAWIQIEDID